MIPPALGRRVAFTTGDGPQLQPIDAEAPHRAEAGQEALDSTRPVAREAVSSVDDHVSRIVRGSVDCRYAPPSGGTGLANPDVCRGGAVWIARTGAPWRDLPSVFGKWNSVYVRCNRWSEGGV